jgi:hypothetical protein
MNNFFFVKTNRNDLVGSFFLTLYHTHPQPLLLSYVIRRGGTISPARARFEIVYLWRLFSLFFLSFPNETLALVARALLYIQTHVSVHLECQFYTHRKKHFFLFFSPSTCSRLLCRHVLQVAEKRKRRVRKKKQKNKRTSIGVCIGKEMRPQTASITNDF